ncbi:MAG: CaiB/BaiF CoA transferase family protein [Beijerinckiaceae bacterium]
MTPSQMTGPLKGIRVVEFEGLGPCPFAAMTLADMGADVVTIARAGKSERKAENYIWRGRHTVEMNLKDDQARADVLRMIASADIVLEGFRPGVMERLGLGPDEAHACNQRLIYGRMTGWGQHGPLARNAGHDINYIAITGALEAFRPRQGEPVSPLNLVGDYGGGALYLLVGVLAAWIEMQKSGKGQVVDAAMCDGVTHMLTMFQAFRAMGEWTDAPRSNFLDGGAHFYRTYECRDGKYMAVGALEPQFYALLRSLANLDDPAFDHQYSEDAWPLAQNKMQAIFKTKTRDEWTRLLENSDACTAPVLSMAEAPLHPHLQARQSYINTNNHPQPAPAPRFSRTPSQLSRVPNESTVTAASIIARWTSQQ